jgi:hypothetical protein
MTGVRAAVNMAGRWINCLHDCLMNCRVHDRQKENYSVHERLSGYSTHNMSRELWCARHVQGAALYMADLSGYRVHEIYE